MNNSSLEAALAYHASGFSVIPIRPCDKKPMVRWEPYQTNTATEEEIRAWWLQWPDANVGICTGAVSGLVVIDIDSKEAKEVLKEELDPYDLQKVPRARTGKGWHLYFKHLGFPIHNRTGIISGVDVRGDGGYAVVPPSIHPSGNVYRWEVPLNQPLPEMPEALLKLITSPGNRAERGAGSASQGQIREGERNATLASLAGTMRRRGMSKSEMFAVLRVVNQERCRPPLDEAEVREIAWSVARYTPDHDGHDSDGGKSEEPWPVLTPEAYHGLVAEFVKTIEPHSEADPVALLVSFLAEFAVIIGRGPHLILDGSYHPPVVFPVLVGTSSKSRKGSAGKRIWQVFRQVDPTWQRGQYKGTLSSGEGLVWAVRDRMMGTDKKGHEVCLDEGVSDKRLLLIQPEFGSVLRVMSRDGNSLSGVIRDSWDGEDLAPMTKGNRIRTTAPHIGIVGHVTQQELLRHLTDTEASNGFGNRFVWLLVRRSKELPFSSSPSDGDLNSLIIRMRHTLEFAKKVGEIRMSEDAKTIWAAVYSKLSADRPGLAGVLLNRAEANVMRHSALYAVLDGRQVIESSHLQAALALWEYAEKSTQLIFGDSTGDPVKDTMLSAIRRSGGLDDTEISSLFSRHVSSTRLARGKAELKAAGLVIEEINETGGRKRTVWRPAKKAN